MAPLKYLSNVWKTLEMIFINSEINLVVPLSANCPLVVGIVANQVAVFAITDIKLLSQPNLLSTQDNEKLLEQLKLWF